MEVLHPHHPTHKKKWSEYIIEFVMLFTAVTLGFFAENIREHLAENSKKNELMKIVSLDLQRDLKQLEYLQQDYLVKFKTCDSLIEVLNTNPNKINTHTFYYLLGIQIGYWNFNPNDKSRSDADSKGYFRNSENAELANYISKYNFFLLDFKSTEDEATRYRYMLQNEMQYLTEEKYFDKLTVLDIGKIPQTIGIKAPDKEAAKRVKFTTLNFKHLYFASINDIDSLSKYATKAIKIINKKYN